MGALPGVVYQGEEEWSEDMEEPEMEFDEMGLELAAQDGKLHFFILFIKIKEHTG